MSNSLQFLEVERVDPPRLSIAQRQQQFDEIYRSYEQTQAQQQSERCLHCGNPYCEWSCPVHNYIPSWLKLIGDGDVIGAAQLCHSTNSLPEMCGRICPQDRLCEGACTLNDDFGAVTIGSIEKYITDTAFSLGWRPAVPALRTDKKIAIIGAGPAGLSCADVLIRNGVQPVVYDAYNEIGGLLTFGIPEFKLEKSVIKRRRAVFEEMGIRFELNCEVGKDVSFDELHASYDAVFIGTGTYTNQRGNIVGEDSPHVHTALDYLIGNINQLHAYGQDRPYISVANRRVVVLGGGDTAMDCNRTAIRQGAAQVQCVYRRGQSAMPGSVKEINNAKEEGVEFVFNQQPIAIETSGDAVTAVICEETTMDDGRLVQTSKQTRLACDSVVVAFGFRPSPPEWLQQYGVQQTENQLLQTSSSIPMQTTNPKIFAGGDVVLGSNLVVRAVDQGRQAAHSILDTIS